MVETNQIRMEKLIKITIKILSNLKDKRINFPILIFHWIRKTVIKEVII